MLKKLTLRQIEVFVAAAKLGSFGDAAAELGITQPALSQAVRDLELDYGAQLFDRSTRPVTLTTVGKQFLPSAERVVNAYLSARLDLDDLAVGRTGRVSISCLQSVAMGLLPSVLSDFAIENPRIIVELREERADPVAQTVRTGEADFGVANIVGFHPEIESKVLLQDTFGVVCRKDHPLAQRNEVRWADLADMPLVVMSSDSGIWREMEPAFQSTGLPYKVTYMGSNPATVLALVAAGVGVGPLPGLAWQVPHQDLVHRPLVDPVIERKLHLIRRRGDPLSPSAALLASYIEKRASSITVT